MRRQALGVVMFGINDNPNDNTQTGTKPDEPKLKDTEPQGLSDMSVGTASPPLDNPVSGARPLEPAGDSSLMGIKEQALTSLSPLVNHLDQTPDERFKTLMMLIQASDNSALINDAYEAANKISDEKTRAQALLDVINEINYFTQKQK